MRDGSPGIPGGMYRPRRENQHGEKPGKSCLFQPRNHLSGTINHNKIL